MRFSATRVVAAALMRTSVLRMAIRPVSEAGVPAAPTHDHVWGLWNEGNLFSLTVAQLETFLSTNNVTPDPTKKKAMMVRQVEEFMQSKDNAAKGLPPVQPQQADRRDFGRGAPQVLQPVTMPETLLDLTQTGFYDSPHAMAPKAFQLLVSDATPEVVVSRVNTTSFPGFPANAECYTLTAAEPGLAIRTRFSKAFQWCVMNMSNLRIDGEFQADFGKLLVHSNVVKKGRHVVSAYSLQQRLQVQQSPASTWVSAVSETSVPALEALFADELFTPVGRSQVSYDVQVRRAKDVVALEMNRNAQVTSVNNVWRNVQTTHLVNGAGVDCRMLLRTRQPLRKPDIEHFSTIPILKLTNDDIADVLAPEHGQVIYVSENEVRRWEKKQTLSGARFTLVETKRQPLIVLKDEEEDPRLEYQLMVSLPCSATERVDLRSLSLEAYDLTKLIAEALNDGFVKTFECQLQPVVSQKE